MTNLTFKQQLIYMMAERCVTKYGIHELTDGTIAAIKESAGKLSAETTDKEPVPEETEYQPFYKVMHDKTIRRLRVLDIETPIDLINHDFGGSSLYGYACNIDLLQYAMNHNIKLKNYSWR